MQRLLSFFCGVSETVNSPNWPKTSQKSPPQDFIKRTLGIREELKVGKNEEEEEAKVLKRAKKSAAPSTPKSLFMRAVE